MNKGYLETLDEKLVAGAARMGRSFANPRIQFVLSKQMPEGGFAGRLGGTDIYYTDFALRTLLLLGVKDASTRTAPYIAKQTTPPRNATECFNRLNCVRLLAHSGIKIALDVGPIRELLIGTPRNAYDALLAALCFEMLGERLSDMMHELPTTIAACREDAENPQQTNSVAAASAFLRMHDALDTDIADRVAAFLTSIQTARGGFLAHPTAPIPDLLSTFTALVALSDIGALAAADLASAASFVRSLATPEGAFRSCESDPEGDVEYTYYGVAAAALLRSHLDQNQRSRADGTDVY